MSNKIQLQTNNDNLDALITRVNAAKDVAASLPEAGGGSIEVWTGTVYGSSFLGSVSLNRIYYTDETCKLRVLNISRTESATITIVAGTIIALTNSEDESDKQTRDYVIPSHNGFEISLDKEVTTNV